MHAKAAHDAADLIAIVGMAGTFPGAPDADSLWTLLMARGDAIRPVPASRWDATVQLDPEKEISAVGGFLDGVDLFDPGFFGISPREAVDVDPQQRLLLEASWRALEDAGERAADLAGSRTGVYVGASWHDYELLRGERGAPVTQHSLVGTALDMLAARISYFLELRGPSLTVETGCSSSLVALQIATRALRAGDIDAAIVGTANLILAPDVSVGLTHFGGLSRAGRCATFSASADGFVRGEGVAAIYVKTLERALADGDRIHGVVVRTVVNNDGGGDSLVTPSQAGQEDLLRLAYGDGLIPRDAVAYIEAHGTGTARGDPVEAAAIGRVLGSDRVAGPIGIGSVKTNIGHLEAAAGMAGLFKVLLALRHQVIPPSLHAADLSEQISFAELNVKVVREALPLPGKGPVYLGVNSFGWGGTNAHAVMTGPPPVTRADEPAGRLATGLPTLVPLSAKQHSVLVERAGQLRGLVPETDAGLAALAGTLAWHRDHFPIRAAFAARQPGEFRDGLDEFLAHPEGERDLPRVVTGQAIAPGRTAFVFPGQGAQWSGMGRGLYRDSPVFAGAVQRCAEALRPHISWDLLGVFAGGADDEWMSRIDMLQPVSWAMALGLAELWRACGVEPDVVVGHSQGEIAAATFAGILSCEDAALIVARRSAISRRTCGRGLMLAVDLDRDAAASALEGFEESVSLAVHNGPTSCVLSGDRDAVLKLKELLDAEGTFSRVVNVDYASHSPHMDELRDDIRAALAPVTPRSGTIDLMSTAWARRADGAEMGASYWAESIRSPVLFAEAMTALLDDGLTHVVEVSPHPVLTPAVEQLGSGRGVRSAALCTLRRDSGECADFARALGRAYVAGLEPFGALPRRARVELPGYPLRRERYWPASRAGRSGRVRGFDVTLAPAPADQESWHGALELSVADLPWLADHKVYDEVVLPGTAILALAVNTARARTGRLPRRLDDVVFQDAVAFGKGAARLTAEWRDDAGEGGVFRLLSLPGNDSPWVQNASARAVYADSVAQVPEFPGWAAGIAVTGPADFYQMCAERGLGYGPAFQRVRSLRMHPAAREALGEVVLGERLQAGNRPHVLHPSLWDGALQACLALCDGENAVVPAAIRRIRFLRDSDQPVTVLWSHVVRRGQDLFDVYLFDAERKPLMAMEGVRLHPLPSAATGEPDAQRLHSLRWIDLADRPRRAVPDSAGRWLVCGNVGEAADELARALAAAGAEVTRFLSDRDAAPAETMEASGVVFVAPRAQDGLGLQRQGLNWLTAVVRSCASMVVPPRLAVVTAMAQVATADDSPDPGAALYWGYARVLRREHGELSSRLIDVDVCDVAWAADAAAEILSGDHEDQVALRGGRRLVARLARGEPYRESDPPLPAPHTTRQAFRVAASQPGLWEGVDCFPLSRRRPGPGEIEIEVTAAALNFIDVMKVMGSYPDPSVSAGLLGGECAGRVAAVGAGVTGLALGSRVVACASGSLASHVTVRADHARPIPVVLADADAAGLPLVLATAWYGLADLGRLGPDETVLVHSAAGGVGLAAIQVARLLGARVIATAGTEHKREYLRGLGIADVFDSRDLSWAESVRMATGGRGADVILNSLAGAAIALGLDVLAEDGRFIEIGKKDIYLGRAVSLDSFRKGISVSAVDMAGLMDRRPERFTGILEKVWSLVVTGKLKALPVREYAFTDAAEALREMSHGNHIGKFVVSDPQALDRVTALPMPGGRFRADSAYLISGGLGALGLSLAEFLAENGAGALILVGRSAPGRAAAPRVEALRKGGMRVETIQCDVSDRAALHQAVTDVLAGLPPLRGVIHAAGVLADATIANMSPGELAAVLAPKVDGARHLADVCAAEPLNFFVLFSSAAALVGNAGQAAYAAANAYLDAFAQARRHRGLPALSVQWGPFAGIGLAAQDEGRGARLEERGMDSFPATEAWPALIRMLRRGDSLVGYVPINLRQWFDAYPESAALPSWEWLHATANDGAPGAASGDEFLSRVGHASGEARAGLVEAKVRELAARVLRLEPDRIERSTSFKSLGLDSLLGLELRNRLEFAFGIRLSPTLLWTYGNPGALASALCERLPVRTPAG